MPWKIVKGGGNCPPSKPYAVVKESDGSLVACHSSRKHAVAQLKALYASESDRSYPHKPPHLRDSNNPKERCGTCLMFNHGKCWGYGNYPVAPSEVCDSWAPEEDSPESQAPADTQHLRPDGSTPPTPFYSHSGRPETDDRGGRLNISVISEQRTYDPSSPFSFFRDQQRAIALADNQAQRRLMRHLEEVLHEVESDSREGRRAVRELGEEVRADGSLRSSTERDRLVREELGRRVASGEYRASTTSTIAGFTTPEWIVSQYAIFRSTQRTFADQCTIMPMVTFGMQINVPRFTSNASAGVQSEGGTVTELDLSGVDNSENVQTIAGQITASQQLIDRTRGMPDGPAFDAVIYKQLRDNYDQSLNNYVLGKAMGLGAHVPGASSWTDLSTFYTDLSTAREQLTDASGVHLMPTHLFMSPDLYGYLTKQVDSQKRPLVMPQFFPGKPVFSDDDEHDGWDQFTGTVMPGVLMWFVDQTIPAAGSNNQWVVSRPETILVWEGEPVTRAFPQTVANQLQVVTQLYAYDCCIPRYPGATATVTGNAYPTTDN